jgi:hypothetical protein
MIRYKHRNCNKEFIPATFCYQLPDPAAFENLFVKAQSTIQFPFGLTLVHKKDQYCKATGRAKSFKNMKVTTFTLNSIQIQDKRQIFYLSATINNQFVSLKVSTDLINKVTSRLDHVELNESADKSDIIFPWEAFYD